MIIDIGQNVNVSKFKIMLLTLVRFSNVSSGKQQMNNVENIAFVVFIILIKH